MERGVRGNRDAFKRRGGVFLFRSVPPSPVSAGDGEERERERYLHGESVNVNYEKEEDVE